MHSTEDIKDLLGATVPFCNRCHKYGHDQFECQSVMTHFNNPLIDQAKKRIQEDQARKEADFDPVQKPRHYNAHPSNVECITITEHMNFCIGNAIKYLWRADLKNGMEDLEKALWYVNREIERRKRNSGK